jgi:O-antigen ligase
VTLLLEIGIAVLLALGLLCAMPECGLFLYGFALGFPDIAIPIGAAINLRLDDGLILLFLVRSLLWTPAPLTSEQRKILGAQALFLFACILSAVAGIVRGNPPASYDTAKMIGCAAIALALPRLLQSERRLRFLIAGLVCAGIALVVQISRHLGTGSLNSYANFQELKNAATFATWNANTIGQASILLVFAAGLGGIIFRNSIRSTVLWPCLAMAFAMIPMVVFVRTTSLSVIAGLILFLCLTRRRKWILLFAAACFSVFMFLHLADGAALISATQVDPATGEGFSHRFDHWAASAESIRTQPVLGQGFSQEAVNLSSAGNGGRSHNAYLSVWVELGLGGLALFLFVIYRLVSVGLSLYRNPHSQLCGALILALVLAACLDSLGLPTLYWEKLPVIALSIAVALAGICERNQSEAVTTDVRPLGMESVPQRF